MKWIPPDRKQLVLSICQLSFCQVLKFAVNQQPVAKERPTPQAPSSQRQA